VEKQEEQRGRGERNFSRANVLGDNDEIGKKSCKKAGGGKVKKEIIKMSKTPLSPATVCGEGVVSFRCQGTTSLKGKTQCD